MIKIKMSKKMESNIECFDLEKFDFPLNQSEIHIMIKKMQSDYAVPSASINIICLDRDALRAMKKKYFAEDRHTDVISFPLETSGDFLEGEIYISPNDISNNADEFQVSYKNEAARVIIHGMLHLLGYEDIETDDKVEMKQMENKYLKILAY